MKIEANLLISKIKKDKFWIISYIVVLAVAVAYCLFNDENMQEKKHLKNANYILI